MYYVEDILRIRKRGGRTEYEIKWEGYDDPTWEPERHIPSHLIEEFSSKIWNNYLMIRNFAKFFYDKVHLQLISIRII